MEQKSVELYIAELEGKISTLTRLMEISSVMNAALLSANARVEALLSYLMDAAAEITDSESASVILWDSEKEELHFVATTSDNPAAQGFIGKAIPLDSIAGTIVKERNLVQVDDAPSDPRHYSEVDKEIEFVTRSLLGVPMIAKNKVIGVLEVVNKKQLPWTLDDRNNLSMLANEAAVAIEVAQLVSNMQQANEELNELDKLKSNFIAIASHELRTPLGIIMGYASFLQDETDSSISDHASKVMAGALQLRRIIDDMINLRYLKQKPSDLTADDISLGDLLNDLQQDSVTLTDANNTHLEIICDSPDHQVHVDRSRMGMALNNILNNAISFSPESGTVQISAWVDGDEAFISVEDNGIGLEADQLEKIFAEFYQVEDHMIRHHGGLGIGLSISRALVKAHGGRVWAESPGLKQGSTFTVALPLAK
jgi:signal transduction histidine kinase